MSSVAKVVYRSYLPGFPGYSTTGVAKPNKQLVIAVVEITNTASGLESFPPSKLGLANFDFIKCNIRSASGGAPAKSATTSVHADYDDVNQRFVIVDVAAAGDRAAVTDNEDPVIEVFAVGDSLLDAELT